MRPAIPVVSGVVSIIGEARRPLGALGERGGSQLGTTDNEHDVSTDDPPISGTTYDYAGVSTFACTGGGGCL